MLPGIGGGELIVIAVVALIVVGPKDLPKLLRQLGRFFARMRGLADDFRSSFDEMARQSELDELRKEVEALRSGKSISPIIEDIDADMRKIHQDINQVPARSSYDEGDDIPSPDAEDLSDKAADVNQEAVKPKRARKPRAPRTPKAIIAQDTL
jgi:sec-independent protein translocase protein TatB